jgi:hypothetical protein
MPTEPVREEKYLVEDWPILGQFVPIDLEIIHGVPAAHSPSSSVSALSSIHGARQLRELNEASTTVGLWKPLASLHLVTDWTHWPVTTPYTVRNSLRYAPSKKGYLPVVYTDMVRDMCDV